MQWGTTFEERQYRCLFAFLRLGDRYFYMLNRASPSEEPGTREA